jgi:hypothetical protein
MTRHPQFLASEAIERAGIPLATVRDALPSVDIENVTIHQAGLIMRRTWATGILAVTTPWGVFAHPRVMWWWKSGSNDRALAELIIHELVHIEQLNTIGLAKHAVAYLADYMQARRSGMAHHDAYLGIEAEVEAREIAHRVVAGV